jgi:hypothetical protein
MPASILHLLRDNGAIEIADRADTQVCPYITAIPREPTLAGVVSLLLPIRGLAVYLDSRDSIIGKLGFGDWV